MQSHYLCMSSHTFSEPVGHTGILQGQVNRSICFGARGEVTILCTYSTAYSNAQWLPSLYMAGSRSCNAIADCSTCIARPSHRNTITAMQHIHRIRSCWTHAALQRIPSASMHQLLQPPHRTAARATSTPPAAVTPGHHSNQKVLALVKPHDVQICCGETA